MAQAFLGLALSLTPNEVTKGEKMLEKTAKEAKERLIKNLAISTLEFVEKFVKKSPTPVQGKSTEPKRKAQ